MYRLKFSYLLFISFLFSTLSSLANCPGVNLVLTPSYTDSCGDGTPINVTITNNSANIDPVHSFDLYQNNYSNYLGSPEVGDDIIASINSLGTDSFMLVYAEVGCSDTVVIDVNYFSSTESAGFSMSDDDGVVCQGSTITFTDNSAGTVTSYDWDFGEGTTASTQGPHTITYNDLGTFNVELTIDGTCGIDTEVQTVTVNAGTGIVMDITGDDGDGDLTNCLPYNTMVADETVTFTNGTTGADSYTWDFGDGSPTETYTNNDPITHTFTSYGAFDVIVTASNAGCPETDTLTVIFGPEPYADFTVPGGPPIFGCEPLDITTVNSSQNGEHYLWDFGDGVQIDTTAFISPPYTYGDGTFILTLMVSNYCGTDEHTFAPIFAAALPEVDFGTSSDTICPGDQVWFFNSSEEVSPTNNFEWDLGDGTTYSNVILPDTHIYAIPGTYTVELIGGGYCGNDTLTQDIVVMADPIADFTIAPNSGCVPDPEDLVVTNNSTGLQVRYEWYVNGALNSEEDTINRDFFLPGVYDYDITLLVINPCDSDEITITVNYSQAAQANFNIAPTVICEGGEATFTDASLGDALNYDWDFGNGNTANTPGPHTETFNTPGSIPVELIVSGVCGFDTLIKNLTVNPNPTADFTSSETEICIEEAITFTNNSTVGGSYAWTFEGGNPGIYNGNTPPDIQFIVDGINNVQLIATVNGCKDTTIEPITVNPKPSVNFTATPANGCAPLEVSFNNTTTGTVGNIFSWDFGNGNTSVLEDPSSETYLNPSHQIDAVYTVELLVESDKGCKDSVEKNITVYPVPLAGFTQSLDTACAVEPIQFSDTSTGGLVYAWNFGDNTTSAAQNPLHLYPGFGTYDVLQIVFNGSGCVDSAESTISIDSVPNVDFTFSGLCLGDSTYFNDASQGVINWIWDFGDMSGTTTNQYTKHLYSNNGSYDVTLIGSNLVGCSDTVVKTIDISTVPQAGFTFINHCHGQLSQFTDTSPNTPATWEWDFGDAVGTSSDQNPQYEYGNFGTYTVQLIVSNGLSCIDTIEQTIEIDSVPTADFSFLNICENDTMLFNNLSTISADTFIWDFNDGSVFYHDTLSHIYPVNGTYDVILMAGYTNSQCFDTIQKTVEVYQRSIPGFIFDTACFNTNTVFTDTSLNIPISWNWSYLNGAISVPFSADQNPEHNFTDSAGTYSVTLVTETANGCVDSTTKDIYIKPLPEAGFTYDNICLGSITQFTDTSSSDVVTWSWNFGDASLSIDQHPSHLYASTNTYDVMQIVTSSNGCVDTTSTMLEIHPVPEVDFSYSGDCLNDSTVFTELSTGVVDVWDWDFGDGESSALPSPSHLYNAIGTYNVILIGANLAGCADTTNQLIAISDVPIAGFTYQNSCFGGGTQFIDTSLNSPNSWEWYFDDGFATSISQNPSHVFSNFGLFDITLIVANGAGCVDTLIQTVEVDSTPNANFNFVSVCENDTLFLTNQSSLSADTFIWNFGDGNIIYGDTNNYIYNDGGSYNVTLVAGYAQSACFDTITKVVNIYTRSIPGFEYDSVCFGEITFFTDTTLNNPVFWDWSYETPSGPEFIDYVPNPGYIFTDSSGIYQVTLITQTAEGCIDSTTQEVFVKHLPEVGFMVDSVCYGEATTITDTSSNDVLNWNWDFGDGTLGSSSMTFNHQYLDSGTYTIELNVVNHFGCSNQASEETVVHSLPIPGFINDTACYLSPTQFQDTSTQGVSWVYSFNDGSGITSMDQNPTHLFESNGIFNVTQIVTNSYGCIDSITANVLVHEKPIADFTFDAACAHDTTFFTDFTSANPTFWVWNYGDGSELDTTITPFNVYSQGGSYNVTLFVENMNGCKDTIEKPLTAYTTPSAIFTADTVCEGDITHFTNQSTDIYPIVWNEWNFGDGNGWSFAEEPGYIYQDSGVFNVSLTVVNDKGCDTTVFGDIVVRYTPEVDFTFDTVCLGQSTTFVGISDVSSVEWVWNYGDGSLPDTISGNTHQYTYSEGGDYIVSLEGYLNGCAEVNYQIVNVYESVHAEIFNDPDPGCFGGNIQFIDYSEVFSGAISSITWDFGDGTISNVQNPAHVYSVFNSYTVMLAVETTEGCVDTAYKLIPLYEKPEALFEIAQDNFCSNALTNFTDLSTINTGTIEEWIWDFGDGNINDADQNPIHEFNQEGTYSIELVVVSNEGCTDTIQQDINVNPSPLADFSYNTVCSNGGIMDFEDLSTITSGSIVNWFWNFGDGTNGTATAPSHQYNIAMDSIEVELVVVSDLACTDTLNEFVQFYPNPVLDFRAVNAQGCMPFKALFEDQSIVVGAGSVTNWIWDFGDGLFSFEKNPSHVYKDSGEYQVSLTVVSSDGCEATDTLNYNVVVHPGPTPDFTWEPLTDITFLNPEIELIDSSIGATSMMWVIDLFDSIPAEETLYTFSDTGYHSIAQVVVNDYGCSNVLTKELYVAPIFTYFIPTAFSPNEDGYNEIFIGTGINVRAMKMEIFDRNGLLVYESYDPKVGWNGNAFGTEQPLEMGVYDYQIFVTDIWGNEHFYKNKVTLIR